MNISSEQLRAQRELVKRHLDWLDAQIAGVSGAGDASPGAPASPAGQPPAPAAVASAPAAPATSAPVVAAEVILETHAGESGLSQGAKFGCVALAAFVVLGFLFVLFVLPRFLYGDRKSAVPPPETGVAHPAK